VYSPIKTPSIVTNTRDNVHMLIIYSDVGYIYNPLKKKILSRDSMTKTRVWIGESICWNFTSGNYNQFVQSQSYCDYSTCNFIH
jgi:hypothetical protein